MHHTTNVAERRRARKDRVKRRVMTRQAPAPTVQLALRIPPEWLKEADEMAGILSKPGMEATRSDGFRRAIGRGMQAIRDDHAPAPVGAEKVISDALLAIPAADAAGIIVRALDNAALGKLVAALTKPKSGSQRPRQSTRSGRFFRDLARELSTRVLHGIMDKVKIAPEARVRTPEEVSGHGGGLGARAAVRPSGGLDARMRPHRNTILCRNPLAVRYALRW